ncbi:O-methyltransferase [Allobacillus sp. GCM10007491]|uniref:tRNA 5-hydroxyuridine methyltransferase n=1 Tax=Allobacillus saliphilus TaxID=2912308 RepID=A0A941HSW8_9BACI|nr:O-methyltransferase [Allobacillus saliphilus]MBR7553372.1 O-methyltransferase [Allobacillus saliphilus]
MRASQSYIQSLYEGSDSELQKITEYAVEHHVPIMEVDGIQFIKQLIRIHRPKKILEIGTAIGYSAIQMAKVDPSIHVTTLEVDETRYRQAIKNIQTFNYEKQINAIHQDAIDYLNDRTEDEPFDFVLIDAAKGKNKDFVDYTAPFLKKNGLLVVDNVLFKGYVSGENNESKRLSKLGSKINSFNQWLMNDERFETTIVETGDGIAVAIKQTN